MQASRRQEHYLEPKTVLLVLSANHVSHRALLCQMIPNFFPRSEGLCLLVVLRNIPWGGGQVGKASIQGKMQGSESVCDMGLLVWGSRMLEAVLLALCFLLNVCKEKIHQLHFPPYKQCVWQRWSGGLLPAVWFCVCL